MVLAVLVPAALPDFQVAGVEEVGIDSMDLATVALVLRDTYSIRIDEDDYPKLTNIRLISEYIVNKLQFVIVDTIFRKGRNTQGIKRLVRKPRFDIIVGI